MTHVVLGAELGAALELLIEAAERRALIAGDERARLEAAVAIGAVLVEQQPDQALHSREEDTAVLQDVLVVQRDRPRLPLARRRHGAAAPGAADGGPGVREARWGSLSLLRSRRGGRPIGKQNLPLMAQ